LVLGFGVFPDRTLRAPVIAGVRDHVDQLVALDTVEATERCLVPPVDGPLDGLQCDQRYPKDGVLHSPGEVPDLADVIPKRPCDARTLHLQVVDQTHACCPQRWTRTHPTSGPCALRTAWRWSSCTS